jgi:hypothetical protein
LICPSAKKFDLVTKIFHKGSFSTAAPDTAGGFCAGGRTAPALPS